MTESELEELLSDCPTLYHMAEAGSWPAIRTGGLLSTSALLDLYGLTGEERLRLEEQRRLTSARLVRDGLPGASIRDQIPMDDVGLSRCLPKHLSPGDWYRLLNAKVFFWLTRDRLVRLLQAGAYRHKQHDVLEIDARGLMGAYLDKAWLCAMNSGCTKPIPHPRDETTFQRFPSYPYSYWRGKRRRGERVVEFAVDHSVPDVERFVQRVVSMRGRNEIQVLFEQS